MFVVISSITNLCFSMELQVGKLEGLATLIGAVAQSQHLSANVLIKDVPAYVEQSIEEPSFMIGFAQLIKQMILLKKSEELSKNNETVLANLVQQSSNYAQQSFAYIKKNNNGGLCLEGLGNLIKSLNELHQMNKHSQDVDTALKNLILNSPLQIQKVFEQKKEENK